ncbi:hypothetical protein BU14_0087s0049 [Porphyra umbilicalis]|uniref:Uncharacterized protein n=1 Tax=Porphyra umbilicalis TaxID=2786 RepID=A0A1X6PE14_PORUM|nr:hypothetical protein BU14_0087s0049 [Porphyra umbilicalis]|eukprot:OSX79102.1 hypothetical protein BU14_0087s0049 [Porphyra umbilicalis]
MTVGFGGGRRVTASPAAAWAATTLDGLSAGAGMRAAAGVHASRVNAGAFRGGSGGGGRRVPRGRGGGGARATGCAGWGGGASRRRSGRGSRRSPWWAARVRATAAARAHAGAAGAAAVAAAGRGWAVGWRNWRGACAARRECIPRGTCSTWCLLVLVWSVPVGSGAPL